MRGPPITPRYLPASSGEAILILRSASRDAVALQLHAILAEANLFSISVRAPPTTEAGWQVGFGSDRWLTILLLVGLDEQDGTVRTLSWLRKCFASTPVIVVAEEGTSPAQLADWLDRGASDFLMWPFRPSDVLPRLCRLVSRQREELEAASRLKEKVGLAQIIGRSETFIAQVKNIPMVARFSSSVLIQGETGTGKELVARSIHHLSSRSSQPFIAVSCAGIPEALAENELFGHAKGAYTGASQQQRGLVAEAHGGTLLLDDVDCLTPAIQAKLLRFLEDKEYRALGSTRLCKADVRVIASSNLDLAEAASHGRFRLDLYHRLNVVPIYLPPLRERLEVFPCWPTIFWCGAPRNSAFRRPGCRRGSWTCCSRTSGRATCESSSM